MKKPTDDDFATCVDTLNWLADDLAEKEPDAYNAIAALRKAAVEVPATMEEWED